MTKAKNVPEFMAGDIPLGRVAGKLTVSEIQVVSDHLWSAPPRVACLGSTVDRGKAGVLSRASGPPSTGVVGGPNLCSRSGFSDVRLEDVDVRYRV